MLTYCQKYYLPKVRNLLQASALATGVLVFNPGVGFACDQGVSCGDDLAVLLAAEETVSDSATTGEKSGLTISVDGETIVGSASAQTEKKSLPNGAENGLENIDIKVKFDGLSSERDLKVTTLPERRKHKRGDPIEFVGNWNYPDWIARAEIRLFDVSSANNPATGKPVQIIELDQDHKAVWPGDINRQGDLVYTLRVYDQQGRYDETLASPLVITDGDDRIAELIKRAKGDGKGLVEERPYVELAAKKNNQLAASNIPIYGGMITVYGDNVPAGSVVQVMGSEVLVGRNSRFVTQKILPPGDHVVDVKVNDQASTHGVEFEREVNIPDNEWFYVGIADVTVGKRIGQDSHLLAPATPGEYDSVYKKGRLAFYLKGKMKGRYLITAALDTREEDLDTLFSNLDKKDPRQLLRRLDPDDYYPVYGDDSELKEDAPTSGKFYVRIERGNSHVMWGNFKTRIDGVEFARYERGLYGAHAELATEKATSFGEPVASVEAFAAQPGTLPQRDEFQGTGGSVYFLKRQDINQGSEQVSIEIRDATSGLVVERQYLKEGTDYSIDYVQGVLILASPLASSTIAPSAVLPSTMATYKQFVIAGYEYTPTLQDVSGFSYGGRAEAWVFDQLRFGVSGFQENTGYADQSLVGADVTWRFTEHSYAQLEWAQSKGDNFDIVTSSDGGFIFNPVSGSGPDGTAEAWRGRVLLDMGDLTNGFLDGNIGFGYEQRAAGFNAPGRYTRSDERIFDAHAKINYTEDLTFNAAYNEVNRADGVSKREVSGDLDMRLFDNFSARIGATHSDSESPTATADGTGARTDVGTRLTWHGIGEDKLYVFGQKTVAKDATRERNDRYGVGFEVDLNDKWRARGEVSDGTSGIGALAGLDYQPNAKDKYYVAYRMLPDTTGGDMTSYEPFGRDQGTIVTGMNRQITDNFSAYSEHDFDMMGTSQGLLQTYGVELTPDVFWTLNAGLEQGYVDDEASGRFERLAPSLSASFKDEGKTFSSRLEARFEQSDDGTRDRTTWLGKAALGLQYNPDWRFLAGVEAVISDSDQAAVLDADFIEASVGWAYRPVENDRLNALFKYTYMHDLPAPEQVNSDNVVLGPKQRSHVGSADFIYDLTQKLSVGAKYGIRLGEVSVSRDEADFVKSTAHLGILRADYHVVKNWDVLLEGRVLALPDIEQVNYGVLAGVYRHIGNNLKVGIGYNFGQFSDDLTDVTLDDEGVFVNVVGKF
jgi:hypothetical protein